MGGDVHVVQLHFAIADQAKAIAQVGLTGPDCFYLRTHQLHACFQGFKDFVFVAGQAVVSEQPLGLQPGLGRSF